LPHRYRKIHRHQRGRLPGVDETDLRNLAIYEQNYLIESQGSYFAGNGTAQGFRTPA
jgi:hypothetical protein